MIGRWWLAACLALAGCMAIPPAPPAPAALWTPVDAATGRLTAIPDLARLAAQFPESASVQRRLLSAAVRDKDAAQARAALARLDAMGYALRPATIASLAPLVGAAEAAAAEARAAANRQPVGVSVPFSTIGPQHRLVEGVAQDRRNHRLYLSSVADRALIKMDDNRGIRIAGIDGGSLFGLAIDEPRRLLWIASGVVDQTPDPATAFRGLIAYHLDRQQVAHRVAAPAGAQAPGDIGLAADGTVYASDSMTGALYRLRPGEPAMETLVASGTLRSPQGIAVRPDGERLYVSDYGYGLAVVDTRTGAVSRLEAAAAMMLDGIDGLYWNDGELIAIQNGTSPMRIIRLALDPSGTRVTALRVAEAAHPEWGEPTTGQIVDGDLIYVSDPQWDRFGDGGKLNGTEPLRPNRIRITPLREDLSPPPR